MEKQNKINIKLEKLNTILIKPSKPTPLHLQTFKLSLLDQFSPNYHTNMTFFYPNHNNNNNTNNHFSDFSNKSKILQNSLSQTLSHFYPLAGRLHDATTIHCNDDGVFFIESRSTTTLSQILTNPNFDALECFVPTTEEKRNMLLLLRFTLFRCGSTAITTFVTHKIVELNTLIIFLNTWAAITTGNEIPLPDLTVAAALFPPREVPDLSGSVKNSNAKFTTRRFIFKASKIEELKIKIKNKFEFHPSRVEVVLALIWKCALSASIAVSGCKTTSFRRSILFQAIDIRTRMNPAVPETAVGNLAWPFWVTVEEESHVAIDEMVKRMRKGKMDFIENKAERFKGEGGFKVVMENLKERVEILKRNNENKGSLVVYNSSSWCNYPLLEFDFGWGKPVWCSSVNNNFAINFIVLMDTKNGGGIEAFVTLVEDEMKLFEQNQELLHYAVLNPTILISTSKL
ncbi:BAHD acyltransferase BIA1-like isoform X1 [Trifolium pratense]|uniref:BAHD acyltransferase BIA1-like isoform X1 n=1 Tax=Trifolium pratense TaxID=57577 RepID=UPI001E691810|nr:BAHD acyltransferase BIA1-like isoform X1 [Trifolium pratense]